MKKVVVGIVLVTSLLFVMLFPQLCAANVFEKFNLEGSQVSARSLRDGMYLFLAKHKKNHFEQSYTDSVMNSFWRLIKEDGSNITEVLYFMALCSVESNFDQYVPTKYGVGISQVVYRVHARYIGELGISKTDFYKSPEHNIIVGYSIFGCYLKSSGGVWKKAATRYNGAATRGYADKVHARFEQLILFVNSLEKERK